jgi:hypothetical protein
LISLPFTRESANSAILVFAVIQESLMDVFSSALPMACADPVIIAPPRTNAAQRVSTLRVVIKSP